MNALAGAVLVDVDQVQGAGITFRFVGESGRRHVVRLEDRRLAPAPHRRSITSTICDRLHTVTHPIHHLTGCRDPAPVDNPREDVMPRAWTAKRERQYEHIKEGLLERGEREETAEEIAARTVNKERARAGEARTASRTSTDDLSSGRRGGLRSHRGPGGRTYRQLYADAQRAKVPGRSGMNKAELERALRR